MVMYYIDSSNGDDNSSSGDADDSVTDIFS